MNSFTLMWSKMLDSSVWQLTKEARLLWVTMLLMKDKEGIVRAAVPGLAWRARLTLKECEEALKILSAPDEYSTTAAEGGRRIIKIEGGWQIVNHELYRCSEDRQKELARLRQQKHRNGWKQEVRGGKSMGELRHEKLERDGASQSEIDRNITNSLPEKLR